NRARQQGPRVRARRGAIRSRENEKEAPMDRHGGAGRDAGLPPDEHPAIREDEAGLSAANKAVRQEPVGRRRGRGVSRFADGGDEMSSSNDVIDAIDEAIIEAMREAVRRGYAIEVGPDLFELTPRGSELEACRWIGRRLGTKLGSKLDETPR